MTGQSYAIFGDEKVGVSHCVGLAKNKQKYETQASRPAAAGLTIATAYYTLHGEQLNSC